MLKCVMLGAFTIHFFQQIKFVSAINVDNLDFIFQFCQIISNSDHWFHENMFINSFL